MAETRSKKTTSSNSASNRTTTADPLRILKADHREVEQLLERLGESEEGAERESMVAELQMKLSLHMELEESMLYPMIAERVGPEDQEEAEIEHRLAREALEKLMTMTEMPGFGAVVEMLKGGIQHHVEEEEKELLPSLRDSMEREEWRELGERIAAAKESAGVPAMATTGRRSSKRRKAA